MKRWKGMVVEPKKPLDVQLVAGSTNLRGRSTCASKLCAAREWRARDEIRAHCHMCTRAVVFCCAISSTRDPAVCCACGGTLKAANACAARRPKPATTVRTNTPNVAQGRGGAELGPHVDLAFTPNAAEDRACAHEKRRSSFHAERGRELSRPSRSRLAYVAPGGAKARRCPFVLQHRGRQ